MLKLDPQQLHHAYLIEGDRTHSLSLLSDFIERSYQMDRAHPDLFVYESDVLLDDMTGEIISRQGRMAVRGDKKIFIVSVESIDHAAQHRLLKTFEEPTSGSHFFLLMDHVDRILPTLRSRLFHVANGTVVPENKKQVEDVTMFIEGGVVERMLLCGKIIAKKDKERARNLVNGLIERHKEFAVQAEFLGDLLRARSYLYDRAPSLKIILEHLALTAPPSWKK